MIDELPDDVLLDIFDFYLKSDRKGRYQDFDEWHTLVHVCQMWRNVVFASPRRLDLRLVCRKGRSVRNMLDIWPALPIDVEGGWRQGGGMGLDDIVAALEHRDRVRSINLVVPQGNTLVAAMQVPFPELVYLELWSSGFAPALSDSFLGGSAPRLRTFRLTKISFPALPNLLLSASDLVDLKLDNIPHSGYIPPASMVGCLSSLNKLTSLSLGFQSPRSRPDQPSPPQSRVVLPALTKLAFHGMREYLADLVARIDTPVLNNLRLAFPDPVFDVPHLRQFIDRAKELKPSKAAEFRISLQLNIQLNLHQPGGSMFELTCPGVPSFLTLLCGQVSHLCSLVERLDFHSPLPVTRGISSIQFLEMFQPFTATRSLNVSTWLVESIASALQTLIGARATEVLPNLRDLFLDASAGFGSVQEVLRPFVDARRLSGHPVAVHYWDESGRAVR